jgi:hypothetical protein
MRMKEFGIFVSFHSHSDFAPLSPVLDFFTDGKFQGIHGKGTKVCFWVMEGAFFLKQIDCIDDGFAVALTLCMMPYTPRPGFAHAACTFQSAKDSFCGSSVCVRSPIGDY